MKESDSFLILVVGCGELGSRHLQAVAALPQVREVEVVDLRPEALALGKQRLSEVADRVPAITYRWLPSLDRSARGGDLCVIASQAEGRCRLVQQVVEELDYRSFLLEKIVAQSVREYEDLLAFSEQHNLSVWVNFKTRAYPFHQRAKALLDPSEPILFNVIGGNHGLATNGIHAVDLFLFYDESNHIQSDGSRIDSILHPSKRGGKVYDLSGTLHGHSEKSSHITISFASDHQSPDHASIVSREYRCIVDHINRCGWESDAKSGWVWRPVAFEGNPLVSSMTRTFVADILATGSCELPTLAEAFSSHRFVLDELLPHFNRLLNKEDDRCPVT